MFLQEFCALMGEHFTALADKEEKENSSRHTPLISESSTSGMKFIKHHSLVCNQPCTEGGSVLSGKKTFSHHVRSLAIAVTVSFPDPSRKSGKRVGCSEQHFLSHGVDLYLVKNVIIFKSGIQVSDTSVHMDYNTVTLTIA